MLEEIFTLAQSELEDQAMVHKDNMPEDKQKWFEVFLGVDSVLHDAPPQTELAPLAPAAADAAPGGDGWQSAGAYSYKGGAISWENGYVAIKQLAESATGHEKDSRFMHETLDAIHAIAAQEVENAKAASAGEGGRE